MTVPIINKQVETLLTRVGVNALIEMFDLVPETLFWIKDLDGNFLHVNQKFVDHTGRSMKSLIGKNDLTISPPHLAEQYMLDDKKVMQGELVTDRLEMNHLTNGEFGWFSTSKRPLKDPQGNLVGTYGFTHFLDQSSKALSHIEPIKVPVDYIRKNYAQTISIEELAGLSCLSVSALERRFKKYLGKTPNQFLNKIRLENARRLLIETNAPILEVAYQCGFTEHSYFSKQFKAQFGLMPSALREQYSGE